MNASKEKYFNDHEKQEEDRNINKLGITLLIWPQKNLSFSLLLSMIYIDIVFKSQNKSLQYSYIAL